MPDGTYNVIGEVIEVFATSDLTAERIRRLQAILENESETDRAVEAIAAELPKLRATLERQNTRRFVLALILALLSHLPITNDRPATKEDVQQAVEKALEREHRGKQHD